MKNKVLALVVMLFACLPSQAKYSPIPLYQMILKADIAVYGEIESIHGKTFTLKVEGECFGDYFGSTIEVNKFQNWTCAQRFLAYKKKQRVFLLLVKSDEKWRILSGGGEGEMLLNEDQIYVRSSSYAPETTLELKKPDSLSHCGVKMDFELFKAGVSGLRKHFNYIPGKNMFDFKIKQTGSREELEQFKNGSSFNYHLTEKCK